MVVSFFKMQFIGSSILIIAILIIAIDWFHAVNHQCKNICKDGWFAVGSHCFKIFESVAYFSDADAVCKQNGASLLSKSSLQDYEISLLIKETKKHYQTSGDTVSFWV